jgi:polo-like kinase 1
MLGPSIIEHADTSIASSPLTQYLKGKLLGKGGFAQVFEVTNIHTSQSFACKIIEKQSLFKGRAKQKLTNEIKIHKSLNHENIVKFFSSFEDENFVYVLLELCTCESLSAVLRRRKRLTELEVQSYLKQVLEGVKYLHSHKIIHRDIKLGNILLNQKMEIKIADFGLSAKLEYEGERKRTICGTPNYMAPEILESNLGHSFEVDVWSLGIMIFTMLVGKPPFQSNEPRVTYNKIRAGLFSFPPALNLSEAVKDLVNKILVLNPKERLSLDQISAHDFLNKNKIPRFLPYSTLTIPLSESYLKAFDRKPNTPREVIKNQERLSQSLRSSSQVLSAKRLDFQDDRKNLIDLKDISESLQTATCTGSNSCLQMKKIKVSSNYDFRLNGPPVWVMSWVDYSNKYGLAYKLSNGCIGVLFNDSSKLISNSETSAFRFFSAKNEKIEFLASEIPSELIKQVQLALYFKKYFASKSFSCEEGISQVVVTSWIPTQDALLFRLSNKVVQVYFRDQTEVFF